MNPKYTIGVKSKLAKGSNIVKYDGVCYYRVPGTGGSINTPSSAVEVYYPPCDALHPSLSTIELSAVSCEYGERVLDKNKVITIPHTKTWLQFKFTGKYDGDLSIIKFLKPGGIGYFTKNIQILNGAVVFDLGGAAEKTFTGTIREYHTFASGGNTYCLIYAASGSSVFVIDITPGTVPGPQPPNPHITPTPTPTPTPTEPVGAPPSGDKFSSTVAWPSSGTDILSIWYDSAKHDLIEDRSSGGVTDGEEVAKWLDRSLEARNDAIAYDAIQAHPTHGYPSYLELGKGIRGGPSIKFTQTFSSGGSDFLKYDSGGVGMDHRAVFIVADTFMQRGNDLLGLVSGINKGGGANSAYGNMLAIESMMSYWVGINQGPVPRSNIYSDTYNGGDGGQYYTNGAPVPDNHPQVPRPTGAIYSAIRTAGTPAYIQGLSVGSHLALSDSLAAAWDGKIGEIVILDDEPDETLRQEIEGYLAWKWGLVEFLPPGHPWKGGPPTAPVPTPLPPTPQPTPVPPPPVPPSIPSGVNLVTPSQLFDVTSQRTVPATLWMGGNYQSEWETLMRRLDTVSSNATLKNTIIDGITSTIDQLSDPRNVVSGGNWMARTLETTDFECAGGHNWTIRAGWDKDQVDNVDSRLMYCLGTIESGSASHQNQTIYDILTLDEWVNFTNAVVISTPDRIAPVEASLNHHLRIDSAGFSYNIIDSVLPLTTLYAVPADNTNPFPSSPYTPPLVLDSTFTRVDISTELMYFEDGLLFWQRPLQIGDDTTLEITVNIPGIKPDQTGFDDTTDLVWAVGIEIADQSARKAVYGAVTVDLPSTPQVYIPTENKHIIIHSIDGYTYKITPYFGKWTGSSSQEIHEKALTGVLPSIFIRVDRVIT
tara:strand:+ start:890 stop:3514 length:2625 start_codon:yes stop_codon:yes gene_type:complete